MEWEYQGKRYITEPINLYYTEPTHLQECSDWKLIFHACNNQGIVWHSKWDKCYKLINVALAGNGHRLKAWIEDVYTARQCVCCLQDLEIVKVKE